MQGSCDDPQRVVADNDVEGVQQRKERDAKIEPPRQSCGDEDVPNFGQSPGSRPASNGMAPGQQQRKRESLLQNHFAVRCDQQRAAEVTAH